MQVRDCPLSALDIDYYLMKEQSQQQCTTTDIQKLLIMLKDKILTSLRLLPSPAMSCCDNGRVVIVSGAWQAINF
jgi:hypothetical protein